MKLRIGIALVICALLISAPFIVRGIEKTEVAYPTPTPSEVTNSTVTSSGVIYYGSLESHQGADTLIVTPAKAYVASPGMDVYVNVTVKFFHAQPCPHPGWKITLENLRNVKVVYTGETKLVNSYTAEKTYKLEVLGNGSVDVVYYYGPGCPYGTEERVTVHFYVGLPQNVTSEETSQSTQSNTTVTENSSYFWINGTLSAVSATSGEIKVGNYTLSVKGRWTGPGNQTYTWKSLIQLLEKYKGSQIKVLAEKSSEGGILATKIEVEGGVYWRG